MKAAIPTLCLVIAVASGCKVEDGVYLPGCIAYAGDSIELANGRFEWDRFTDAVEVDASGNVVDPYPDYPKVGTATVTGDSVVLTDDDGNVVDTRALVTHAGRPYLLTAAERAEWQRSGLMPACALVLGGHRSD